MNRICVLVLVFGQLLSAGTIAAEKPSDTSPASLLRLARAAYDAGHLSEALGWATQAVQADPKNRAAYYIRGQLYEAASQPEKATADYDVVLQMDPEAAEFYQLRGAAKFKMGKVEESILDFDKYLELKPARLPHHWQRGISFYYAGRYADGRRQFEAHQTVNQNDVENAVWHFLCVARLDDVEKARSQLMRVPADPRVPMQQIHELFAGKGDAAAVLTAARANNPSASELKQRLFYAHLYLGLYYEAIGEVQSAKAHMTQAAGPYLVPHYMGDVAKVHIKLRTW